jgi:hypothetical protein
MKIEFDVTEKLTDGKNCALYIHEGVCDGECNGQKYKIIDIGLAFVVQRFVSANAWDSIIIKKEDLFGAIVKQLVGVKQ